MNTLAIVDYFLVAGQCMLAFSVILAAYRIFNGPRAQDRILGLDTLYVNVLLSIAVFCLRTNNAVYIEIALIMSFLGFAATAAMAKFLMRGDVIE